MLLFLFCIYHQFTRIKYKHLLVSTYITSILFDNYYNIYFSFFLLGVVVDNTVKLLENDKNYFYKSAYAKATTHITISSNIDFLPK